MRDEKSERRRSRKVLAVLHQAHSTPGRLGCYLHAAGVSVDIRRPSLGDALPDTLRGYDGVIVFGGPMSANDREEWIGREIGWLETPLREGTPLLGICLGAQMLAKALGADVFNHSDKRGEIGYYSIQPQPDADALCSAPFPRCVYQWHSDGFTLPRGARLLAEGGEDFPAQAFRYGPRAVALQFHPEVTYQMMCRWTSKGYERLTLPGAQQRQHQLDGWGRHDAPVAKWARAFLRQWLSGGLGGLAEAPEAIAA